MDFRKRFPLRLWRPSVDEEGDAELEFHLEMRRREHLARTDVNGVLGDATRGAGSRGVRDAVRSTLVVFEVALALMLLVGAGLLIRTSIEMQRTDPGFEPASVFTGRVLLPRPRYESPGQLLEISRELEAAVSRIPGVLEAAVASAVPGARSF